MLALIAMIPSLLLYLGVGCLEWWLALRRTLCVARGEKKLMVIIVFIENLLGLFVLQNFVASQNWWIAIAYSLGGALGALFVMNKDDMKPPIPKEDPIEKKIDKILDSTYK